MNKPFPYKLLLGLLGYMVRTRVYTSVRTMTMIMIGIFKLIIALIEYFTKSSFNYRDNSL